MAADDKAVVSSSASAADALPLSELKRLGKYQIEKKIGAGGMGAVFLARDTELKRVVALKVLPRDKAANPILVRRFRAEAQACAQLRHNNIVAVFDSGEDDGYLYIAMEYVDGQDLFDLVSRRGVVPVKRSIEIIKQVAQALQHAYEQNIVHRDIKPSNLLIRRDGVVKLTDLGLARSVDDTLETNITRAGTTVGTVDYMSPEQARNSKLADIRSDLYSLGCTWYQMLTGAPPFPEGSVTNKLQAHATKPIPDPRDKNPAIPEGLTAVIRRMMAKKPEDRYQTPADLLDELSHATLTHAAISREIFSDLSDYDQDAVVQFEDEDVSDGYLQNDDVEAAPETPEDIPNRPRKKQSSTRSQVNGDTQDAPLVSPRSKVRPSKQDEEEEVEDIPENDESVATRKSTKPSSAKRSRVADEEIDSEDAEPDESPQKSRPKSSKSDSPDSHSRGNSRAAEAKPSKGRPESPETLSQGIPKTHDAKSARNSKTGPQKQLPPKRQPVSEETEAKPGIPKEWLKYLGAATGIIVVVGGLGLLIFRYSDEVAQPTSNPFAVAQGQQPNAGITVQTPTTITPAAEPASNEAQGAANAAAGTGPIAKGEQATLQQVDLEKIPEWAESDADTANLQQFTVGRATKSGTHFNILEEAIQAVPGTGAVIRLLGDGPFVLPRVELAGRSRVVITGATPQDRPVVTIKPAEGQSNAGLRLSDGRLEIRGIHFVIERKLISTPLKAIEVVDGQLVVRQSSFTSIGTGSSPTVAMAVSSVQDSNAILRIEPTALIEQVFVRGEGITGFGIQRANLDTLIRDSLFVTGSGSGIEVSGHVNSATSDILQLKPRRILRIFRSTICTHGRAFDLAVDETGKPPRTAVVLRDSLCCSLGVAAGSTVAFVGRWPKVQSATESWLPRLTWSSSNTLYIGFEQLIDLNSSFKVTDATSWQRVWNSKTDPRQFQKFAFPEANINDLSIAQPQEFDPKELSYREVKASNGGLPGCEIGKLQLPEVTSQNQVKAMSMRPSLSSNSGPSNAGVEVRKVDLKKEDLGTVLNRADWASGTQFEATGGGLCFMSPARIEGKSVKIVFRQTEGANFKLQPMQPKTIDATRSESPAAMITIVRGTLDLTNASMEGFPISKGVNPEWLIQAIDSTLILNGCRLLQGAESEAVKQLGLVRWITNASDQSSLEVPKFVCRDSYLAGVGSGIRLEVTRGILFLRNTVLAVRGDAIDIRPTRTGTALMPIVDAENSTFSATGAAIRFEAAAGEDEITSPMRLFVDRCVFAPPLSFKAGESAGATLLRCVGPVMEQHQIAWWGTSVGIARQVVHLIRRDEDSAPPNDEKTGLTAWRRAWDKAADLRLLTGDKGVYLISELPGRWKDLKPGSFELHKASQAMTWADGGLPIGANTQAVESAIVAKKPGMETQPKAVVTPGVPAAPGVPAKKSNIGF